MLDRPQPLPADDLGLPVTRKDLNDVYYIQLCAGAGGNPLVLSLRSLRVLPICCARVVK